VQLLFRAGHDSSRSRKRDSRLASVPDRVIISVLRRTKTTGPPCHIKPVTVSPTVSVVKLSGTLLSVVDSKISLDGNSSPATLFDTLICQFLLITADTRNASKLLSVSHECIWLYSLSTTIREPNFNSFGTTTVSILPLFSIFVVPEKRKTWNQNSCFAII
jgi:hypothetical protein